jgi:hypothetical protein
MFVYMSVMSNDDSLVEDVMGISMRSFIRCIELFTLKVNGSGINFFISSVTS